ncbi:hypothetical protein [Rhodococcus sp. BH4]|uniref:hypothetical protein n=1 Tax=Rhodococcus sp. BH4 TaxID=1807790 RepID=UPI0018DE9222|nr:hypothetical protein [Rhodococcus sp. BH4]
MTRSVYGAAGFVCRSAAGCSSAAAKRNAAVYEGQLSHVGLHYDMFEDGKPLRVLVLGMEMGRPDRHISLEGEGPRDGSSVPATPRRDSPDPRAHVGDPAARTFDL